MTQSQVAALEAEFAPLRQLPAAARLALLLQLFNNIGDRLDTYVWTVGPGEWTCDGGTLALAFLADMVGLERTIQVGLYWHQRAETLAAIRGGSVTEILAEGLDEHHHWLEIEDPALGRLRIDPNAEERDEKRLQRIGEADHYEPRADLVDWLDNQTQTREAVATDGAFLRLVARALKLEAGRIELNILSLESGQETWLAAEVEELAYKGLSEPA